MTCGPVREAIGVFQDEPSLGAAVEDLLTLGFDRFEISVRVERRRVGRESGATAEQAPKHAPEHAAEWADRPRRRQQHISNMTRGPWVRLGAMA